ncbi:MAG: CDP-2,3-bis-(O-geranylgeranyl)-sn-glycerol synthase [Nitrososphaerota archaeon]|nr:CDP-2,3-bis-(O-geranylgeranyl)-sn-glycerol synthase [Nitrososphaerota archaeon]
MLGDLITSLLYILPAYIANASPVLGPRLFGRRTPIDRGILVWDGRRLFGDGKTFEGLITGILFGTIVGLILFSLNNPGAYRSPFEPLLLSIGTMIGDIFGSFLKRRLGLESGASAPILDQTGFAVFALFLGLLFYGPPSWFNVENLLLLLLITGILHLATNSAAYVLGLKDRPY